MAVAIAKSAEEWEVLASRSFVPLRCDSISPSFVGTIENLRLSDAVSISTIHSEATVVTRTPKLAALSDNDDVHLSLQLKSKGRITQGDRTVQVNPGSIAMYELNKPYRLDYSEPDQGQIVIQMSRKALGLSAKMITDSCGQMIAHESGTKKVFFSYISSLVQQGDDLTEAARTEMSRVASDLAATMIRTSYSGAHILPGSPHALMVTIQSFIREHSTSSDLTPDAIAHEHFISRRKLYDLFAELDLTPAAFIRQERLRLAARMIGLPNPNADTIASIAYACGFADVTTFTRAFRKQFGCTPREWRQKGVSRH